MPTLGIDLTATPALALLVDDTGRVVERAAPPDVAAATHKGSASVSQIAALIRGASDAVAVATIDGREDPVHLKGSGPVKMVAAGAACVVAETWKGAAAGAANAVCLIVGERVFAGILLDGKPWRGARGRAGAAAWLALNPVERQDYRKFGSLAAEISEKGIARRLSWRIQAGDESSVLELAGDLDAITATHVFDGARNGDGVSISVVRDTARYIGMAVASFAAMIDPEVVVVGGSVAAARDLLLEPIRQEIARRLPPDFATLRVEFSDLGRDAVAIGAARLAMERASA